MKGILPILLFVPMLFPAQLPGGASPEDRRRPRVFAPPPGTWTEYRMTSEMGFGGLAARRGRFADRSDQTTAVLIRAREGGGGALLVNQAASERGPAKETMVFLRFAEGSVELESGPVSDSLAGREDVAFEFLAHAFESLEAPSLVPPARWTTAERQPRWSSSPGEFEHVVERADPFPGALVVKSRRTGPLKRLLPLGGGPEPGMATAASREILFDEKTGQLLSCRVIEESSPREPEDQIRRSSFRRTVEIAETTHRALTAAEAASFEKELAALKHAAPPSGEPAADPLPILDEYEKAFPEGLLRRGVSLLRSAIEEERRLAGEAGKRAEELRAVMTGRGPAPEIVLRDLVGQAVSLSDFRGKPVLLSFGDFSTPAGKAEARFLGQWQEKYADRGLVVISVLDHRPRQEEAAAFAEQGIRQRVLFEEREPGSDSASSKYGVFRRPVEFYLDREGRIVLRKEGFLTAIAGLREEKINELLLERKP